MSIHLVVPSPVLIRTLAAVYASALLANLNAREGLRARWAEVPEVSSLVFSSYRDDASRARRGGFEWYVHCLLL